MASTAPLDRYCVLGHPVAHSRSPWIHACFARLTGQALSYDACDMTPDGFADGLNALIASGVRGCSITVPFKHLAARLAQHLSPRCQLAQAANVLSLKDGQIWADNTDGIGLVTDIVQHAGVSLRGIRLLLIGAGGAAAGILGPLIDSRPAHIGVTNRTLHRAQSLVESHQALASLQGVELQALDLQAVPSVQTMERPFDVVINATACSLQGAGVPVGGHVLGRGALAYDLMYGPQAQGFLDWARQHGAVPRDGLGMLVEQAAEAFLIWRGVRPPTVDVVAQLRDRWHTLLI